MAVREDVIYNVKLTGTNQVIAESKRTSAAVDSMKRHAASSSTGVPLRGVAGLNATSAKITALQAEATAAQNRLATKRQALDREANALAASSRRRKPAFGERGRAVAMAAGAGRFSSLAAPFGGWGPLAAIGGGFMAISQFKQAMQNIGLNQQLSAQTAAGIKSTGGAAHVTSGQIDRMSVSLGHLAGIQDETVHDSENILLTFTGIRNSLGKNNKIFDQASLAVANMATRMHVDMPQAALQLGKALNDPVKGMTALRRVGVQFTNQQMDQIKVLVASGNRMGAQKIILRELNREFGGSAKAAGKTLPAAFVRLSEAWEDARNRLVIKSMPAMTRFANFLSRNLPGAIDKTLTALSLFDTDPRSNALSRWLHRSTGGSKTGGAFDYLLTHSGIQVAGDAYGVLKKSLNDMPGAGGRGAPSPDFHSRYAPLPGSPGSPGHRTKLGSPFEQTPVKVNWSPTDPLDVRPVVLVADGKQIANVVIKGAAKRAHAEGRGSAHR